MRASTMCGTSTTLPPSARTAPNGRSTRAGRCSPRSRPPPAGCADVWNVSGADSPGAAAGLSEKLDEACREMGRDPGQVRRSVQHVWDGRERTALVDRILRYAEAGFTEHIINCQAPDHARVAAAAAEALPDLRKTVVPLAR